MIEINVVKRIATSGPALPRGLSDRILPGRGSESGTGLRAIFCIAYKTEVK